MERKKLQRVLVIVFGLAFIGSTGIAIIAGLFNKDTSVATNSTTTSTDINSAMEQLQEEAQGYAKVLEREPENTTALFGLLQISLQTGDLKSAIAPLETLIKLYPERQDFADLLAEIKIRLAQQPQSETTDTTQK